MNGEGRFGSGGVGEACGTGPNVVGPVDSNTCSYRRKAYCNGSHAHCVDGCEMCDANCAAGPSMCKHGDCTGSHSFGYGGGKGKLRQILNFVPFLLILSVYILRYSVRRIPTHER